MPRIDPSCTVWRRSSHSHQNGECVELAALDREIAVRDSKNPDGPRLVLSQEVWGSFTTAVSQGSFDLR
jgi:hypothetical protein